MTGQEWLSLSRGIKIRNLRPPHSSSIDSNTRHGRDCWKWTPDNHQMNSGPNSKAWQHLTHKEDVSKAWMTVHIQKSLQESPQQTPSNETYFLPSSNEYLLIWSTETRLLVSSGTLHTVLCQHTQNDSGYLHIMPVEDALLCCLLTCDLALQAQLASIDIQLTRTQNDIWQASFLLLSLMFKPCIVSSIFEREFCNSSSR
jgi:hypothetical protein